MKVEKMSIDSYDLDKLRYLLRQLSKEDIWDNLIRVKDDSIAAELLEEERKIAKEVFKEGR